MAAPHLNPGLDRVKRAARDFARGRRAGCDPALGAELARHVLADLPPPPGVVVAGFWPLGDEIDIRPLLSILYARGHAVVLPQTPPVGQPLVFRIWQPGAPMVAERFGTMAPDGPIVQPDWLFIPLLAFDRAGHRLGYGGGFYDRTLAGMADVVTIGCGYAVQELDAVPVGGYDALLHAVATERGIIRCRPF